ncbi:hypothetical protein [Cupriavidus sp. D39]|uniref:hypothetical protein n=1 Tax=Cupriavidus sp. D39 TaxID=2997877 RepID=UPI00226FEF67|nr:hypothetical protein [Cupriavidus sp. D39]MCY0855751.1 hypothetical protein [Cupriavidus sp. D39]
MKRMAFLAAPLLLTACVTFGQMDDGLRKLSGRSIDDAISVLGYPDGERDIAGRHLYVWGNSSTSTVLMPQSQTTYGNVTSNRGYANYSSTSYSSVPVAINQRCEIILEVDYAKRITKWQYQGNLGGCRPYIQRLNELPEAPVSTFQSGKPKGIFAQP